MNRTAWILVLGFIGIVFVIDAATHLQKSPSATSGNTNDGSPAATQTAQPKEPVSLWEVNSHSNPVTGEFTRSAYLKYQGKPNIYVRQKGKTLECYINTDDFLETIDNLHSRASTVQYKFDDGKVIRQTWTISDDNKALFYPGSSCKPFLIQMQKAKSLAIEYRPADTLPKTAVFDVEGFPDVFTK
jgi:hypothetical protein